jgi:tetratricopeptide (TPR) repeat protein
LTAFGCTICGADLGVAGSVSCRPKSVPGLITSLLAYIPVKVAHDIALLPLVRTYRYVRAQAERLCDAFASHELGLIVMPVSAETRLRLRRHHEARANAKRAVAADPNNAAAWHRLGNALSGLKRHKEAIACYDKALALAPENRTIWRDRGAAIHASRRTTAANSDVNEDPAPDPQDADAWAFRAGFLLAAERWRPRQSAGRSGRIEACRRGHIRRAVE